jgi:hypothetical protein
MTLVQCKQESVTLRIACKFTARHRKCAVARIVSWKPNPVFYSGGQKFFFGSICTKTFAIRGTRCRSVFSTRCAIRCPSAGTSTPGVGKRSKGRVGYWITEPRGITCYKRAIPSRQSYLAHGGTRKLLRIGLPIIQAASHDKVAHHQSPSGGVPHGVKLSVPERDPTSSDDRGR